VLYSGGAEVMLCGGGAMRSAPASCTAE